MAWCGTTVHQSDVGGPVAGSIAVGAQSIFDEPIPLPPVKIVEGGRTRRDVEREYLIRSRTPDLNALDLLGQIAANRLQTQRILELCQRYGTDSVVGTFDWLTDSTERRLRERLRELPDGRWRHVGFVEHDGVDDLIYPVRLTMTKADDHLELDFSASCEQAPGLINCPVGLTRAFVLATVMPLLGYDGMPWVPAAFERVISLRTRPGTVTHAQWPAGVSLGGTSTGHEVRTCINACLARLLGASGRHGHKVMASCMSSAPGQTIGGRRADGVSFTSMLLDAQLGGGGARAFADGTDTSGLMHSPGGACANIEVNESNFPILYLWRAERADSGGPGRYRGGIGGHHAFTPHEADGPIELTVWAHGVEQPTAAGVQGGEPGTPNGFLLLHDGVSSMAANGACREPGADSMRAEVPEAKSRALLQEGDVLLSWCGGGGGLGDPLDRDPELVADDVINGHPVSPASAVADYGVILVSTSGSWVVDRQLTHEERRRRRIQRLGGREPLEPNAGPVVGRRIDHHLVYDRDSRDGALLCGHCGLELGPSDENVKRHLVQEEVPSGYRWSLVTRHPGSARFVVRRFYCPHCATQLDVEVNMRDAPLLYSTEVLTSQAGP